MAEAKVYGRNHTLSFYFTLSIAKPPRRVVRFPNGLSFDSPKPPPHRVLAMVVKRSPKRLKYSAPRFPKEDGLLYVEADPSGADSWKLDPVIQLLKEGAVGVIPTDTLYAIVCHLKSHAAIERLRRIKNIEPSKYTFILNGSKELPKQCVRYGTTSAKYAPRKNVGVRIPDDAICQEILEKMDAPLISTSVKWPKDNEWMVDPVVIADIYGPEGLDFVVDGGVRVADPSTVVDMTVVPPRVIRQGKGPKLYWMVAEDDNESALHAEDLIPSAT
ncbi:hypothetical protein P3X46_026255 [Hevea brasiliensis]|uniref:Threonylcarbamoyl-AMP synthase n=1 Tax=Hevea brasiliensis TaxID=3981 RepID=A0ABQ9KXF6_HEVBR|nr:uncharacterized protein LOC110667953 isoform X2 [Hevea brasiliensis]KAJ9152721.1 hypothetical protein P3X46_026255 [Hevea brasiliensis]